MSNEVENSIRSPGIGVSEELSSACPLCASQKYKGPCPGHGAGGSDNEVNESSDECMKEEAQQQASTLLIMQRLKDMRPAILQGPRINNIGQDIDELSWELEEESNYLIVSLNIEDPKLKLSLIEALEAQIEAFEKTHPEYMEDIYLIQNQKQIILEMSSSKVATPFIQQLKNNDFISEDILKNTIAEKGEGFCQAREEEAKKNDSDYQTHTPFRMVPAPSGCDGGE